MRRYLQGTLDFACGIYAVINALSCAYKIDLAEARYIFQETGISLAEHSELWKRFVRNETDHYWLVRYMLWRWCCEPPRALALCQPFGDCLLPDKTAANLTACELFLPETEDERGPAVSEEAGEEALAVWRTLENWFDADPPARGRTALLRFHRFLPHVSRPVVSHWTTVHALRDNALQLHDASSEASALLFLDKEALLRPPAGSRPLLRIVPESLVLLEPLSFGKKQGKSVALFF